MTLRLPLRLGTRGSPLALAQARMVKAALAAAHPTLADDAAVEIVVVSTQGDRIQDRTLAEIGGKGLFTEEIEAGLLEDRLDIAVHSMKDMPTVLPDGLVIPAVLPRADPRDALIARGPRSIAELPQGAVVGTASLRRAAQLKAVRPDLRGGAAARQRPDPAAQARCRRGAGDVPGHGRARAPRPGGGRLGGAGTGRDAAGRRPGRGRDRMPGHRRRRAGAARSDQPRAHHAADHHRAGLPRGAGRFLPHADRRPGRSRRCALAVAWAGRQPRRPLGGADRAARQPRRRHRPGRRRPGPRSAPGWRRASSRPERMGRWLARRSRCWSW